MDHLRPGTRKIPYHPWGQTQVLLCDKEKWHDYFFPCGTCTCCSPQVFGLATSVSKKFTRFLLAWPFTLLYSFMHQIHVCFLFFWLLSISALSVPTGSFSMALNWTREKKSRAGRKHLYSLSMLLLASDSIKCFFTLSAIRVYIRNREACIFSDLMVSLPPCPPRNGLFTCVSQTVFNLVRSHWFQAWPLWRLSALEDMQMYLYDSQTRAQMHHA